MCPYTVHSVDESTVTLDKIGVAIPVSRDLVTKMPRVPNSWEHIVGSDNTATQPEPGTQESVEGNTSSSLRPFDRKPAECVVDQLSGIAARGKQSKKCCGTGMAQKVTFKNPPSVSRVLLPPY